MKLSDPIQPVPDEPCQPMGAQFLSNNIGPPANLVDSDPNSSGRLMPWLRAAAQTKDSVEILTKSAAGFYLAGHPTSLALSDLLKAFGLPPANLVPGITLPTLHEDFATALADLSVTGRAAYASFRGDTPNESTLIPTVQSRLAAAGLNVSVADVTLAATSALDRAYTVAHALRGPVSERISVRAALKPAWIAVSAEDDPPHRPVNVESAPFPQYEIAVTVPSAKLTTAVQTRFFIASLDSPSSAPAASARSVPVDEAPQVPNGDQVILFIHGHTSNAEEALPLVKPLQQEGLARGVHYSIIAFDFPNNGYSATVKHTDVADSSATTFPGGIFDGQPIVTPILDFLEDFIVAFVDELDRHTLIKSRFAGVIGGSLGGNMGLRLGRRNLNAFPWLKRGIVSWSPASVWDPMVRDEVKRHAPEHCRDKWDEAENDHLPGPSTSRSNYFREVFLGEIYDSNGSRQHPAEVIFVIGSVTGAVLGFLIAGPFGEAVGLLAGPVADSQMVPPAQPAFWYRDSWQDCKSFHILQAFVSRQETYNENFRQWHWRVAGEQLVFSHVDRVDHFNPLSPWRYELNRARQLLASGEDDNYKWSNIFDATRTLASLMSGTPGRSLFLLQTGHSIHAERPRLFARQIVDFLLALTAGPNEDWTHGSYFGTRGTFFADVDGDGRPDAIVVNDDSITVRRSTGHDFGTDEDWTHGPYFGPRGTFFADVDGDGRADAIVVTDATVTVRRSAGSEFGPNEDWTRGPYFGTRGTFFADVDGDGRADAIVVNDDTITVRRSNGFGFGPNEDWTHSSFFGTRGTFFADVDGDGRADAIMVTDETITVRRSSGSGFGPKEDWTQGPYFGTRGIFFADVDGDGRADAIVVNDDTITVRRSTGSGFGPNEDWTHGPYFGTRGTFFADVDGDGCAEAIVVNDGGITVRRGT